MSEPLNYLTHRGRLVGLVGASAKGVRWATGKYGVHGGPRDLIPSPLGADLIHSDPQGPFRTIEVRLSICTDGAVLRFHSIEWSCRVSFDLCALPVRVSFRCMLGDGAKRHD